MPRITQRHQEKGQELKGGILRRSTQPLLLLKPGSLRKRGPEGAGQEQRAPSWELGSGFSPGHTPGTAGGPDSGAVWLLRAGMSTHMSPVTAQWLHLILSTDRTDLQGLKANNNFKTLCTF